MVSTALQSTIKATLLVLMCLLFFQVVARYGFAYSSVYVIETCQILFVWVCFLGIAEAYRRGAHVAFEMPFVKLPPIVGTVFAWLVHALNAVAFVMILWGGVRLTTELATSLTSGMRISVAWIYAAPVVSGALLLLILVEKV
jgi:TRAP-type transport system small permease protein